MKDTYFLPVEEIQPGRYSVEGPFILDWAKVEGLKGLSFSEKCKDRLNFTVSLAESIAGGNLSVDEFERDTATTEEVVQDPNLYTVAQRTVQGLTEWVMGSCQLYGAHAQFETFLSQLTIEFCNFSDYLGEYDAEFRRIRVNLHNAQVLLETCAKKFPQISISMEDIVAVTVGHEVGHSLVHAADILGRYGVTPSQYFELPREYPVTFGRLNITHKEAHLSELFAHSVALIGVHQQNIPMWLYHVISKQRITMYAQAWSQNEGITRISNALLEILMRRPQFKNTTIVKQLHDYLDHLTHISYSYPLDSSQVAEAISQKFKHSRKISE